MLRTKCRARALLETLHENEEVWKYGFPEASLRQAAEVSILRYAKRRRFLSAVQKRLQALQKAASDKSTQRISHGVEAAAHSSKSER